jgi:hypothetical protein
MHPLLGVGIDFIESYRKDRRSGENSLCGVGC